MARMFIGLSFVAAIVLIAMVIAFKKAGDRAGMSVPHSKSSHMKGTIMQVASQKTSTAQRGVQNVYLGLAGLILAGIVLQGFFIGAYLFAGAEWGLRIHGFTGLVLVILALVLAAMGLPTNLSGRAKTLGFVLFGLTFIQMTLPSFSDTAPLVAALHPANAMILFGLIMYLLMQMRQTQRISL
jgi:hypothetical protein